MTVSLSCFSPVRNPLLHLHTPCLQQKLSFSSEDLEATFFPVRVITLLTNTAQTSAKRIFWSVPEEWNWQTEWKPTVVNTWLRCRIEINQSKTCCVSREVLLVSWKANNALKIHKMAGPLKTKQGEMLGKVSYKMYNYPYKQTGSYLDLHLSYFYKELRWENSQNLIPALDF